jgi:hypothetical protein
VPESPDLSTGFGLFFVGTLAVRSVVEIGTGPVEEPHEASNVANKAAAHARALVGCLRFIAGFMWVQYLCNRAECVSSPILDLRDTCKPRVHWEPSARRSAHC